MKLPAAKSLLVIVGILSIGVSAASAQSKAAKPAKKAQPGTAGKSTPAKKAPAKKKQAGDTKKKKRPVDQQAVSEWETLDKRRKEIGVELKKLREKFSVASRANKLKIKAEFEALIDEWKTKVEPKMEALAFRVLSSRPGSELALEMAEDSHRNGELAALTESLIADGYQDAAIVRAAFTANLSLNRYKRARQILADAGKTNSLEFVTMEKLKELDKHIDFWNKEQELRAAEAKAPPAKQLPRVRIETNRGVIEAVLFENQAPNTVANFVSLAEGKKYDGVRVHYAEIDAITGAPSTKTDYDPKKDYRYDDAGYTIKCECFEKDARLRFRGNLVMHHEGLRDSGGSQFAFVRATEPRFNTSPIDSFKRTVFGYVVKGMDVVDALEKGDTIKKVTVLSKRNHPYQPKTSLDTDDEEGAAKKDAAKTGKKKTEPAKKAGGDAGKTKPKKDAPKKAPAGKAPGKKAKAAEKKAAKKP